MIIYSVNDLKIYETCSAYPDTDWTGKAEHIIDETDPDKTDLIAKIKLLAPCFDYVLDDEGNLIDIMENDVVIPEPEVEPVEENVNYDELAIAIQEGVNEV